MKGLAGLQGINARYSFYANKRNKPLVVISIDQAKPFDRLIRGFWPKILRKFGFGDFFWFIGSKLFTPILCILWIVWFTPILWIVKDALVDHLSESFKLQREVRHRSHLSPRWVFNIHFGYKILIRAIRRTKNIKGLYRPRQQRSQKQKDLAMTLLYILKT